MKIKNSHRSIFDKNPSIIMIDGILQAMKSEIIKGIYQVLKASHSTNL